MRSRIAQYRRISPNDGSNPARDAAMPSAGRGETTISLPPGRLNAELSLSKTVSPQISPATLFSQASSRVKPARRLPCAYVEGAPPIRGRSLRGQFALASRIDGPLLPKRSNRPWMPAETHAFTLGDCTLLTFCCPTSSWVGKVVRPTPRYGETANCEFTR